MCNYSMTLGCPPPPSVCQLSSLPATSTHTQTIHTHTSLATPARSHSTVLRVPVGGSRVVRIAEACWERDVELDFPVDLCQRGFPTVKEVLQYQELLKDSQGKSRTLTNLLFNSRNITHGFIYFITFLICIRT